MGKVRVLERLIAFKAPHLFDIERQIASVPSSCLFAATSGSLILLGVLLRTFARGSFPFELCALYSRSSVTTLRCSRDPKIFACSTTTDGSSLNRYP